MKKISKMWPREIIQETGGTILLAMAETQCEQDVRSLPQ